MIIGTRVKREKLDDCFLNANEIVLLFRKKDKAGVLMNRLTSDLAFCFSLPFD